MTFARSNNYQSVIYDPLRKQYRVAGIDYSSFERARLNQWQCDKCGAAFAGIKRLKEHKGEIHSY